MKTEWVKKKIYEDKAQFDSKNQSWREKIVTKGIGATIGTIAGSATAATITVAILMRRSPDSVFAERSGTETVGKTFLTTSSSEPLAKAD